MNPSDILLDLVSEEMPTCTRINSPIQETPLVCEGQQKVSYILVSFNWNLLSIWLK